MTPALAVQEPGLCTTVQDLGRPGRQRFGVPPSGALDPLALRIANLLVGNDPEEACLEIAYRGPTLTIEADSVRIACAGADARIQIEAPTAGSMSRQVKTFESFRLTRGETLRIGTLSGASVLYLAVEGGFAIEPVLGSRSTYLRGGIGGVEGRPLRAGDQIPLNLATPAQRAEQRFVGGLGPSERIFRVIPGPQVDWFAPDALERLCERDYVVGADSDRMGLRLEGPPIPHVKGYNIVSDVTSWGSIQIPGAQTPIVLLVDRQTTGGYPKIATVISADLAELGRQPIGAKIRFRLVTQDEALEARRAFMARLAGLDAQLRPVSNDPHMLSSALLSENIVSGVHNPLNT